MRWTRSSTQKKAGVMDSNKLMQKVLTTGVSLAGGYLGTKIVDLGWKAMTGEKAPSEDDEQQTSIAKIVTFAAISAAISSLITSGSQRGVRKAMEARAKKQEKTKRTARRVGDAEV
ncbi:DUF4235 domain-containing protein [Auritidibacter ignavus]|nr:DUF4235 domain-containing protein [Auritidibacter sp. NML130574]PXA78302.1 hypothetical protein DCC24_01055 [Auritidibacter sp. NML100628]PXA79647.1 hypothetical protein DCC26_05255 [Auritidibacter sp. NML120779]PXA81068.1 hypothetical protein DCC25_04305 [Auritidibacter sp. NML120636]RMX23546.1 DUF4235 domain-containing protein [Auritidibacter ignavus]